MENQNNVVYEEQPTVQSDGNTQNMPNENQVDNFGKRLERAFKNIYETLGVPADVQEQIRTDRNVFKNWLTEFRTNHDNYKLGSDKVASLESQINELNGKNYDLAKQLAFLRNGVDETKENDILTYCKGLDKPFTEELLLELLQTHPEWLKKVEQPITLNQIGQTKPNLNGIESFEEKKKRIYGL